jgi:acyl-[acyl-carrier-protein]-phospholipid O-acyltransferase/long-chain-fatty-acid--[acyl-carrier-protein] ligase
MPEVVILWRFLAKVFFRIAYRIDVRAESLELALANGGRVILAPHYASFIDPVLFGMFLPGRPTVVVSPSLARQKWFGRVKGCFDHAVIDLNDAASLKRIDDLWKATSFIVLFPEPEPTTNGLLMKLSEAAVAVIQSSKATVIAARALNTQYTRFSRMGERLARHRFPKVSLFCGEARKISDEISGDAKSRRGKTALALDVMMMDVMAESVWDKKPIFDTLLEQRAFWGPKRVMAMEPDGSRIDWNGFITRIFLIERIIGKIHKEGDIVGIMLPNSLMTLASIIGCQHAGKIPAMLNYSMGARSLIAACGVAKVRVMLTSRRFVEEGKFGPLVSTLSDAGIAPFYLEDEVKRVGAIEKIGCLLSSIFASPTPNAGEAAKKIAVVLFTSGSEGTPKPVALSHLNIQANTAQVRSTLDFFMTDVMLDVMPMFHSFGLCTGTIMPLSTGMPIAFYPTPLHYKKIPQYAYETRSTILLGTNAFLAGYAKNADAFDFFEIKYVICGGDKLKENTVKLWMEKFGKRVLEGYGVTECSPVVGVNKPGYAKFGSIGRPLPCVRPSLLPVEGVARGGRLVIKGPNLMMGYIQADGSILQPPAEGYDTGDIVSIDEDGFITIEGRARRFAKIGGEMVSLAQIEAAVQEVWPDEQHAIVSVPDENRGEVIVLLTERPSPDREELRAGLAAMGLPELVIPKRIVCAESIPRIGVGKTDYESALRLAKEERQ